MRYPAAQQGRPLATKDSENYVGTSNQAQYRRYRYAIFDSDQMSKHQSINKKEVDTLLNIDSFKLINEPLRSFPLITT